jgi:hypothetical protein
MQNKANLRNDKMNITLDMTINYKILPAGSGPKTKPIQTQFKPNLSQFKPISETKNESFCVDKELYNDNNNAARGIYHPEGCQFKANFRG